MPKSRHRFIVALLAGLAVAASAYAFNPFSRKTTIVSPPTIAFKDLEFTCSRELDHVLPPSAAAEALFQAAREQHRQALAGAEADLALLKAAQRGYRQAADAGHWKGLRNLAFLAAAGVEHGGRVVLAPDHREARHYAQQLADLNVATGYNLLAAYASDGWGGVKKNEETALAYMRRAADLGLPSAQRQVGDRLSSAAYAKDVPPDAKARLIELGRKMMACAVRQGDREAAFDLATKYKVAGDNYPHALFYYFQAGKMGESACLMVLRDWFAEGQYGYAKNRPLADVFEHYRKESHVVGSGAFPELDRYVTLPPPPAGGSYPPAEMGWPNAWSR